MLKRSEFIILLCILFFGYLPLRGQNSTFTLEQLLQMTELHYPSADASDLHTATLRVNRAAVKAGFGPILNLNAEASWQSDVTAVDINFPAGFPLASDDISFPSPPQDVYKLKLDVVQPIYQGGSNKIKDKEVILDYTISQKSLAASISQRKKEAAEIYFALQTLEVSLSIMEAYQGELYERLKQIESAVRNGTLIASNADILRAESIKTLQQITQLSYAIAASRESLVILTGESSLQSADLPLPLLSIDTASACQRPELEILDLNIEKMQNNVALIDSYKKPSLSAFSQLGYGRPGLNMFDDSFSPYAVVGLKMNWNIWDGRLKKNKQEAMRIQGSIVGLQRESLEQGLQIQGVNAHSEILKYEDLIKQDVEIIALRSKVSKAYVSQLENGVITSSEYISQLNEETRAKLNLASHRIGLEKAKATLLFTLGIW